MDYNIIVKDYDIIVNIILHIIANIIGINLHSDIILISY